MERTKTLRSGLRTATAVVFLAAALLSTGCSGNALLNPQSDQSAQSASTANGAGHDVKPAGHDVKP